jgi:FKBP-type peptidyl-prolyl cis-trans isomerase SlyD
MQIAAQKVVTIEYTLKNEGGEVLDSSEGGEPLAYLHGAENIVAGLEKALEGKAVGDTVEVTLQPEEAYGQRDERLIQKLPVRKLPEKKVQVGARYRVMTDQGPRFLLVKELRGDYATVDANHPLAGLVLHFAVKVTGVRDATPEELEHKHVHGAGGHHH